MWHGVVITENVAYSGLDKVSAKDYRSILDINQYAKVGHRSYYFVGFSSEILKWLIDNGDRYIEISNEYTKQNFSGTSLMIRSVGLMDGASKQLITHIQSSVAGVFAGTNVVSTHLSPPTNAVQVIQSTVGIAMDGQTVADRTGIQPKIAKAMAEHKPNKFTQLLDRMLNKRMEVRIGCHFNTTSTAATVIDTKLSKITCSQIAGYLMGRTR